MKKMCLQHFLVLAILAGVLALALMLVPAAAKPVHAASIILDHFDDLQSVSQTGVGSTFGANSAVAILGGTRKVTSTVTSGSLAASFTSNNPPSKASISVGSGTSGFVTIVYDGSSTPGVNPIGLSPQDFTNGGADTALILGLSFEDSASTATFTVWSSATSCSTLSRSLPGGFTSGPTIPIIFNYASFTTGSGCSTGATFSSIRAVQLLLDLPVPATDLTIDFLETGAMDFGDLPDDGGITKDYNTLFANNGAAHVLSGTLMFGSRIDSEPDGQPSVNANGDDINPNVLTKDEDGVKRSSTVPWSIGPTGGSVDITVSGGPGCVSGWIDWNNNGVWQTGTETIINNALLNNGTTPVQFTVPGSFLSTNLYYARFRIYPPDAGNTCTTDRTPDGQVFGGEVEDYQFGWQPTAVELSNMSAQSGGLPLLPIAAGGIGLVVVIGAVVVVRRRK